MQKNLKEPDKYLGKTQPLPNETLSRILDNLPEQRATGLNADGSCPYQKMVRDCPNKPIDKKGWAILSGFAGAILLIGAYFGYNVRPAAEIELSRPKIKHVCIETIQNVSKAEHNWIIEENYIARKINFEEQAQKMSKWEFTKSLIQEENYSLAVRCTSSVVGARALILAYIERNGTEKPPGTNLSFKDIHANKSGIYCAEAAVIAAAALHDNLYPPLILIMKHTEKQIGPLTVRPRSNGHAAFIYKQNGKFGYIDNNKVAEPLFETIEDIVRQYTQFKSYSVFNLDETAPGWLENSKALTDFWRSSYQQEYTKINP